MPEVRLCLISNQSRKDLSTSSFLPRPNQKTHFYHQPVKSQTSEFLMLRLLTQPPTQEVFEKFPRIISGPSV